jgi:transcriptional regulator with XRE-family HTH domain
MKAGDDKTMVQEIDQEKTNWSEQTRGLRRQLGERITEMRMHRGLSRAELAERLAVPCSRLGKWEGGHNAPPPEDLVALSGILHVSTDELLTGRKPVLSREMCSEIAEHVAAAVRDLVKPGI